VTYRLGRRSYASVLIKYDRKATIPGHDHVLVSRDVRGQVTWTEGNPSACKINVEIPASSLLVDPPGSRKRAGLEGETSEGDRKAILENALGKRQLDAAQFPTLSFVSTACLADGDRVKVSGMLTIHGVGKAVSPSMNIQVAEGVFTARGRLAATHADFGMEPYTAVLGALRNDPALSFDLEFVGE
jgi:polyisoprenoid-binding protein YceI